MKKNNKETADISNKNLTIPIIKDSKVVDHDYSIFEE
jgi:hypothetical protein